MPKGRGRGWKKLERGEESDFFPSSSPDLGELKQDYRLWKVLAAFPPPSPFNDFSLLLQDF
jgi:hypothetical protein